MKYIKEFEARKAILYKVADVTCVYCTKGTRNFSYGKVYELYAKKTYGWKEDTFKVINDKGDYVYVYPYDKEEKKLSYSGKNEFATCDEKRIVNKIFTKDSLEDWIMKIDMKIYNL